jgi:hypothetical protein
MSKKFNIDGSVQVAEKIVVQGDLEAAKAKVYTKPEDPEDVVRLSDLPMIQIITWGEDD